ncbi:MAG: prepilin peptidase [Candidatus Aenigmatarchaeota archaeon]
MIEIIILALIGSAVAGLWDLKTTEVPDELPYLMATFGIVYWLVSGSLSGDMTPFIFSMGFGAATLIIGFILYKKKKMGGADVWVPASILFMVPLYNSQILAIPYFFNAIFVSAAYIIVYSLALGLKNTYIFSYFLDDMRKHIKWLASFAGVLIILVFIVFFYTDKIFITQLEILLLVTILILFWRYAKVIEKKVFIKKIPVSELKVGDVVDDMEWRGLTADDIKKIRKEKKYVTIKDGVRFVPVFPITLVVTLLYGNILFLMF